MNSHNGSIIAVVLGFCFVLLCFLLDYPEFKTEVLTGTTILQPVDCVTIKIIIYTFLCHMFSPVWKSSSVFCSKGMPAWERCSTENQDVNLQCQ